MNKAACAAAVYAHPQLLAWAMTWVDAIAQIYWRNDLRLAQPVGSP